MSDNYAWSIVFSQRAGANQYGRHAYIRVYESSKKKVIFDFVYFGGKDE